MSRAEVASAPTTQPGYALQGHLHARRPYVFVICIFMSLSSIMAIFEELLSFAEAFAHVGSEGSWGVHFEQLDWFYWRIAA